MGNIMENVKKAQQLVQVEAAKAQEELAAYVLLSMQLHREYKTCMNKSAMLYKLLSVHLYMMQCQI